MKIFLTGDTHSHLERFYENNYDGCTKENTFIIICGDFGAIFRSKPHKPEILAEQYKLDGLNKLPATFIIVLGNHENYDAIEANYPIQDFHGAKARYLRDNIVCIERGEIFELNGKKFWCFGGAYSIDYVWRTPKESWWYREQASPEEFEYGEKTFIENQDKIDYIITHDAPATILSLKYGHHAEDKPSETEMFLNRIMYLNDAKAKWFCGHLHFNYFFKEENLYVLYEDIIEL